MAKLGKAAAKRRGRAPKAAAISELETLVKDGGGIVLMNNLGLSMAKMTELRKKLRDKRVAVKVAKNTLLRQALKNAGYDTDNLVDKSKKSLLDQLTGQTMIAVGLDDPVTPAKEIVAYLKAEEEAKLEIKGGLLDRKMLTTAEVNALAKLPGKNELIARLLGSLNAPAQNMASVLYQSVAKFGYALSAYEKKLREQQGGEAA